MSVKGRGMMQGIDVGSGELASVITSAAFEKGLIIETSGPHDEVVKVLAPLTIDDDVFSAGLDIVEGAVRDAMTPAFGMAAESEGGSRCSSGSSKRFAVRTAASVTRDGKAAGCLLLWKARTEERG